MQSINVKPPKKQEKNVQEKKVQQPLRLKAQKNQEQKNPEQGIGQKTSKPQPSQEQVTQHNTPPLQQQYSQEDKALLAKHVTSLDRPIYVIYNLPPEVVAVLFAYVSRSPLSFRDNLLKLIKSDDLDISKELQQSAGIGNAQDYTQAKKKAKEFHERWVVGYGHSSVAEHAYASVALEDVSILASKVIEDNRLASYTEKSTRYQVFDKNRYYKPKKIMQSKYANLYTKTAEMLFDAYDAIFSKALLYVKKTYPNKGIPEKLYESISKARACDIARYLLPAATLTNLAMTANARVYEHAIRKLLSHELEECQDIGLMMKEEIQKLIPTLVKYADRNEYLAKTPAAMRQLLGGKVLTGQHLTRQNIQSQLHSSKSVKHSPPDAQHGDYVCIVDFDADAENKILAAILYRFGSGFPFTPSFVSSFLGATASISAAPQTSLPAVFDKKEYGPITYDQAFSIAKTLNTEERKLVFDTFLAMGRHDWPMRELEHVYYTYEIQMDYGAYRDIQRHRMCTQTTQLLTTDLGFSIPDEIAHIGMEKEYNTAMNKAKQTYETLRKEFALEAQYIVPLGYRIKSLFTWNLRELYHFIKLRSGKEGHVSYRKIAIACYDELEKVHPLLAKYLVVHRIEGPSRG
ncbi:MAG: FAD-dependent thymidylate synthase [Candidatus Woesearchaeota archaeon]